MQDNYMEISLSALERNARKLTAYMGVPVIGVLKCDGYGVGGAVAAEAWRKAGVTMFAVSSPSEALRLRQTGATEDILLMAPVTESGVFQELLENRVVLTAVSAENARFYRDNCGSILPRVHVAVDTGMGRFGVRWTDKRTLFEIYGTGGISAEGIYSHFSASWEKRYRKTKVQYERFMDAISCLENAGINQGLRHIANSGGALRFPETHLDAVRIGSALVGRLPASIDLPLETVGEFRAKVVQRKVLKKGDTVGYGAYRGLRKETEVAVIAVGQQNGFGMTRQTESGDVIRAIIRALKVTKKPLCVRWKGIELPLLGVAGSEYSMIDVTGTDISPGEYVSVQVPLHLFAHERRYIP